MAFDFFKYIVLDDQGKTEQDSKMLFLITLVVATATHPMGS
ncbi:hypothetical protein P4H61_21655 [Paenibacillus peoriae]|nr:hypothetical protein [Paenibacillus peoriae]MEC0184097.1 hypothetical protein [Paenibacillus peoriae]